ncbi:DUF3307 domain-containing protein (plasmid) [Streptomyces sp. NBC_01383]|uniref:DUF3307 domain-containing protein n=1 Tax=Streptomyces sp. NBC_01383 TaxID=2903846 RepID=UPI002F90E27D
MFGDLFAALYIAHMLADYVFQTDHQSDHKADRNAAGWLANIHHAGTHVVLSLLALLVVQLVTGNSLNAVAAVAGLLWIGTTHGFIDRRWPVLWWMNRTGSPEFAAKGGAAYVDQALHIAALGIAALVLAAV